jgi:glycosyltransferase involved in cell wall biosynthesis
MTSTCTIDIVVHRRWDFSTPAAASKLLEMPRIRVAVVADVLLTEMGGVARSVRGITRELGQLDPDRLQVTVVAKRRPEAMDGLAFRRSFSPRVPKIPGAVFALQRPFTLDDYDIVHYMDSRPPLDYPLGRRLNVVTQHGFGTLTFGIGNVKRHWIYLDKVLLRLAPYADLTFTASESERSELLDKVQMDPSSVIAVHHGIDHDRFFPRDAAAVQEEVRARFGIDGRYVLYVSNHQRKKNTERLVEAFAAVAAVLPDVSLVLTGWHTPRFRLVLDVIERLGLQSRVRVLGHVPDDALPALYAAADAFTLPSLHEGFGLPVLEAMACGTPVIASNAYSLPEVCGDAAELVDPYSVESITEGILRVLEDRERATELRERGLTRAPRFTWRRAAERHLEGYERLLAGKLGAA